MTGGELIAVPEDRAQGRRNRSRGSLTSDKVLCDAETFQPVLQPLGRIRVVMTIRNEGAVFRRRGLLCHHCARHRGCAIMVRGRPQINAAETAETMFRQRPRSDPPRNLASRHSLVFERAGHVGRRFGTGLSDRRLGDRRGSYPPLPWPRHEAKPGLGRPGFFLMPAASARSPLLH